MLGSRELMESPIYENGILFWAADGEGGVLFSDIPTRAEGRRPDFVLIGAAKTATTSLAHYLGEHPGVFMWPDKEPHFFSTPELYERGTDWYEGLFADAEEGQLCGEASTSYTRYPYSGDVAKRMHDYMPEAKLIYLIREPVARIISALEFRHRRATQMFQRADAPDSLDELLDHDIFLRTSEYIVQIEQFMKVYPREQLLVLLQEELAADGDAVLRRALEFIGADPSIEVDTTKRLNTAAGYYNWAKHEAASGMLNKLPGSQMLKKLIPQRAKTLAREFLARRVPDERIMEPLSEAKRAELVEHFAPFNARLEEFLGRRLHEWD